jgi:DNA polymerase-3 subunit epsilon
MREIVLDTETTGLKPEEGHRIIEIGCIELKNHVPTGNTYHQYINPCRDMPTAAYEVHGLSEKFLSNYPKFSEVYESFLEFIGTSSLVIHNAAFDMKFLNAELGFFVELPLKNKIVDTLDLARKTFPGSPASLDALCKRFKIDNSQRIKHGALLDSEILAEVYLELLGGRQIRLFHGDVYKSKQDNRLIFESYPKDVQNFPERHFPLTQEEKEIHENYVRKHIAGSTWYSEGR